MVYVPYIFPRATASCHATSSLGEGSRELLAKRDGGHRCLRQATRTIRARHESVFNTHRLFGRLHYPVYVKCQDMSVQVSFGEFALCVSCFSAVKAGPACLRPVMTAKCSMCSRCQVWLVHSPVDRYSTSVSSV